VIVVDNSVLVPAILGADPTSRARRVLSQNARWILPPLWQFEFTNSMVTLVRRGVLTAEAARSAITNARLLVHDRVVPVDQLEAHRLAIALDVSGYDAQYIALAQAYGIRCLTNDRHLAKRAGESATLLEDISGK
jgi:predicted nucleic acid-binding protein